MIVYREGDTLPPTSAERQAQARQILALSHEGFKRGLYLPLPQVVGMDPKDWIREAKKALGDFHVPD